MSESGEEALRAVVADASEHVRSDESTLADLAALAPIEYDRRREAAAESLGVRVATLDAEIMKRRPKPPTPAGDGGATFEDAWKVEPWPSAVDTSELLEHLRAAFARHVILPPHAAEAAALWVLHTWAHDAADTSPILLLTSPEKRCGKTQAISVLARLVSKPLAAANISGAALFRAVEKWRPTLLIDEADTFAVENDELRGLLNSGHSRATARAIRTVGDDHEPRSFSTWAPKAIACIGNLRDTITDRSIEIRMKRKQRGETVARIRGDNLARLEMLRRRASRWSADSFETLLGMDPEPPDSLNDRAADSWRPLLAIADHAGEKWPRLAREAAVALSGDEVLEDDSARAMLLEDLRALFEELGPRLGSKAITDRLATMEARPWPEWKHGKPITPRQLASLLRPFGVAPRTLRTSGETTEKGYARDDLEDAFSRYLPPSDPSHGHNACGTRVYDDSTSVTRERLLPIAGSRKAAPDAGCDRVTDREAGSETWTG